MSLSKWFWDLLKPVEKIHPYYEKTLPEAETFLSGEIIAKNWDQLNNLAEANGLIQFSSLRFSPLPLSAEGLVWNNPGDGVFVLEEQVKIVREHRENLCEPDILETELERILLALGLARRRNIRFTLVRRFGNSTNRLVWEAGGGSI